MQRKDLYYVGIVAVLTIQCVLFLLIFLRVVNTIKAAYALYGRILAIIASTLLLDWYAWNWYQKKYQARKRTMKGPRMRRVLYQAHRAFIFSTAIIGLLVMCLSVVSSPVTLLREDVMMAPSEVQFDVDRDEIYLYMMSESTLEKKVHFRLSREEANDTVAEGEYDVQADTTRVNFNVFLRIDVPGPGSYSLNVSLIDNTAYFDYVLIVEENTISPPMIGYLSLTGMFVFMIGFIMMCTDMIIYDRHEDTYAYESRTMYSGWPQLFAFIILLCSIGVSEIILAH